MIKNNLIQFIRFIRKDLFHSFLNILGLAVGMASCIVILLYIQNELTYDKQHQNYKDIFKYGVEMTIGGNTTTQGTDNAAMGIILREEYPEIKNIARFRQQSRLLVTYKEKDFYEESLRWADSTTFDVFSYKFIAGIPKSALNKANQIVLTEKLAKKYFGDENPIGEILDLKGVGLFNVTAVIKDLPDNSTLLFDGLISFETLNKDVSIEMQRDPSQLGGSMNTRIYFQVHKNFSEKDFYAKFDNILKKYYGENILNYKPVIEPISEFYLNSKISPEFSASNRIFLLGFSAIGILILILASINYVNLATSRAMLRAKEVGIRKVVGARFWQLVTQYCGESLLLSLFAMIIALGIVELIFNLTSVNRIIGINLTLSLFNNSFLLFGVIGIILFTGGVSGLYPSLYLSRITPISSIKKDKPAGKGRFSLRKLLVAFQFIISILVVSTMMLMKNQIDFAKTKDLGFDSKNIMILQASNQETISRLGAFKEEIKNIPGVIQSSLTSSAIGTGTIGFAFKWEDNKGEMQLHAFQSIMVDKDFALTYGLVFVEGGNFNATPTSPTNNFYIVNEALVNTMGWDKAVGKFNQYGTVVGVVKNFNATSIRRQIGPLFMALSSRNANVIGIKLADQNLAETVKQIKQKWEDVIPGIPCEYSFLDERIKEMYIRDTQQSDVLKIFSIICTLISCLGLLSLTSFTTERRTKEIGIRKVFGAQTTGIVQLITKEISVLLIMAAAIALPLSVYIYGIWLNNFAYKTSINAFVFVTTFFGAAIIILVTSSYHVFKAAKRNPIESIKCE
jgi:putative ABC transport system permease protein